MHIAFFNQDGLQTPGGLERVTALLASELAIRVQVSIISFNSEGSFFELPAKVKILNLGLEASKNSAIRKIKPLLYIKKLNSMLKCESITHLISSGEIPVIMMSLLKNTKIKKISWVHNCIFQPTYKIFKYIMPPVFKNIDSIVMTNKTDMSVYKNLYGNKVVYIPNANSFESDIVSTLNHNTIITIGRLSTVKNYKSLLRVFNLINKKNSNLSLKIIGKDEGESENLNQIIHDLNLKAQVKIISPTNNIIKELLSSDLFVMTSLYECFGMVLLEAKVIGLPIVSFDCDSGPRDIIQNGKDGFLVEPNNERAMADAILKIMNNQNLKEKFGKNAKADSSNYSAGKNTNQWLGLLNG